MSNEEKKAERDKLKKALEDRGVTYPKNATNERLEELLANSITGEESKKEETEEVEEKKEAKPEVKEEKKEGEAEEVEEVKAVSDTFTMARNVKHDGILYKEGKSYAISSIDSSVLDMFKDKEHIK